MWLRVIRIAAAVASFKWHERISEVDCENSKIASELMVTTPKAEYHPEQSEGSMESARGKKMHRSFASLRMTMLIATSPCFSVLPLPPQIFRSRRPKVAHPIPPDFLA